MNVLLLLLSPISRDMVDKYKLGFLPHMQCLLVLQGNFVGYNDL